MNFTIRFEHQGSIINFTAETRAAAELLLNALRWTYPQHDVSLWHGAEKLA